jgi:hypothetical protein
MRWVNNHIYFMKQKSPLGKRILEQVRQLPFEDSPKFVDEVINKTCKPKGYFAVTDGEQYRDFYNFCVLNLIKASEENKGNELDNVLFDQPLVSLLFCFISPVLLLLLLAVIFAAFPPSAAAMLA